MTLASLAQEFAELEVAQKSVQTVFLTQPTPGSPHGMGQTRNRLARYTLAINRLFMKLHVEGTPFCSYV